MRLYEVCKITPFDDRNQFCHYINTKCAVTLYTDKTGMVNLSKDGYYTYKIFKDSFIEKNELHLDDVLTCEDINDTSYLYSRELFPVDDNLLGFKVPYYGGSRLDNNNRGNLNTETLKIAYYEFKDDTLELSEKGIYIPRLDVIFYNGNEFIVPDTYCFIKDPKDIKRLDNIGDLKDANMEIVFDKVKRDLAFYSGDIVIDEMDNDKELFDYLEKKHGKVLKKRR